MIFIKTALFVLLPTILLTNCSPDRKRAIFDTGDKDTAYNVVMDSGVDTVVYRTGDNDIAEIILRLNPDSTVNFYFKSFPFKDETDTLNLSYEEEVLFKSNGAWKVDGDNIELYLEKSTEIDYGNIFTDKENAVLIVNDSTFSFDKQLDTMMLWRIYAYKIR